MPEACVNLVKENDFWEIPYKFEHPSGLQIVNGNLPENYSKLDLNVSVESLAEETQLELDEECDEGSVGSVKKIIRQQTMRYS